MLKKEMKGNKEAIYLTFSKNLLVAKKKRKQKTNKETVEAMHQTHHNVFKGLTE